MCLVGTGSSGIASGQVSPALGERELMTHLFCFLFSLGPFFLGACFRFRFLHLFPSSLGAVGVSFSGSDLPVIRGYGCLSYGLIFG